MIHPEPAAIDEVGLEGLARSHPAPGEGPGDEGVDIAIIDPDPKAVRVGVAKDIRKRERALIVAQEQVLVGLVGKPQPVFGVVEANRLPAFGQRLHQMAEHVIVEISNKPRHSSNRYRLGSDH